MTNNASAPHCAIRRGLAMPWAAMLIAIATAAALSFAFIMQYGFDIHPCILCLWQRVPFGLAFFASLVALMWRPYGRHTYIVLAICALALLTNAGLAVFHTGVERHWWLGTSGCSIQPLDGASIDSLREQLLNTIVGHCDEISWSLFGLSMANYNIPFSLGLGLVAAMAVWRGLAGSRRLFASKR